MVQSGARGQRVSHLSRPHLPVLRSVLPADLSPEVGRGRGPEQEWVAWTSTPASTSFELSFLVLYLGLFMRCQRVLQL